MRRFASSIQTSTSVLVKKQSRANLWHTLKNLPFQERVGYPRIVSPHTMDLTLQVLVRYACVCVLVCCAVLCPCMLCLVPLLAPGPLGIATFHLR